MVAGPDQTDKAESGKLCEVCKASSQRNRATAENPISCQAMAACWSRSFPVEQGNVPCGNFSRYIEVVNLTTITTAHVKDKFKSIFTSLLSKGEDAHKSLMVYRATPSSHGSSLAQLLITSGSLCPSVRRSYSLGGLTSRLPRGRIKEGEARILVEQKTQNEGKTRTQIRTNNLGEKHKTDWNHQRPGTEPRSYNIDLPSGSLQRNRSHIRIVPETPRVTISVQVIRTPIRMDK